MFLFVVVLLFFVGFFVVVFWGVDCFLITNLTSSCLIFQKISKTSFKIRTLLCSGRYSTTYAEHDTYLCVVTRYGVTGAHTSQ